MLFKEGSKMNEVIRRWPKKGDIDPVTGKIFFGYRPGWVETWMTREERLLIKRGSRSLARGMKPRKEREFALAQRNRFGARIRGRITRSFSERGFVMDKTPEQILGCSNEFFCEHICAQFVPEMNWFNNGTRPNGRRAIWQVDHVIALAYASTKDELEALWRYSNMRPIWAKDNWSKTCKMPDVYDRQKSILKFQELVKQYLAA
jgi:hypothetical protein